MKKILKRFSKLTLAAVLAVMMGVLTGCTAVQISANITLNEDGTGTRTITASIAKNDYQDGYGSAYYYLTKHGDQLEKFLQDTYKAKVTDSEKWLEISVNDSGKEWEVINLSFEFNSFEDYKTKLAALAFETNAAGSYVAPELTVKDGKATYTENVATLTAIFKSIQTVIMADNTIFDINSTKDGKALNDGSADLTSLTDYGVELMKPEFGNAMTIKLGSGEATTVEAAEGVFSINGKYEAKAAAPTETEDTATDNSADDTKEDATDEADSTSMPKTGDTPTVAIVALIGLAACAAGLVITKRRQSQN